jgi:hypothetical protein
MPGWSALSSTARSRSYRSNAALLLILMRLSARGPTTCDILGSRARWTVQASLSCSASPTTSMDDDSRNGMTILGWVTTDYSARSYARRVQHKSAGPAIVLRCLHDMPSLQMVIDLIRHRGVFFSSTADSNTLFGEAHMRFPRTRCLAVLLLVQYANKADGQVMDFEAVS